MLCTALAFELFYPLRACQEYHFRYCGKCRCCKGTFYLYFKDKYDIRNKLISHKSRRTFSEAHDALKPPITSFTAQLHFIVDNILDRLETEEVVCFWLYFQESVLGSF